MPIPSKPKYFDKHPCTGCGTGYGECAQGLVMSLQCCIHCDHPTRWQPDPWDADDLAEFAAINDARNERR